MVVAVMPYVLAPVWLKQQKGFRGGKDAAYLDRDKPLELCFLAVGFLLLLAEALRPFLVVATGLEPQTLRQGRVFLSRLSVLTV